MKRVNRPWFVVRYAERQEGASDREGYMLRKRKKFRGIVFYTSMNNVSIPGVVLDPDYPLPRNISSPYPYRVDLSVFTI
jgi:hypothetical protein